jgi:hypothetical protein
VQMPFTIAVEIVPVSETNTLTASKNDALEITHRSHFPTSQLQQRLSTPWRGRNKVRESPTPMKPSLAAS